jgi:hypothetical protein
VPCCHAKVALQPVIGSIRRECLDHVIVLHESGLRRVLRSYVEYYDRSRTHLAPDKDAPVPRAVEAPHSVGSWKCPRSDSTIDTNDARPDLSLDLVKRSPAQIRVGVRHDRHDGSPVTVERRPDALPGSRCCSLLDGLVSRSSFW